MKFLKPEDSKLVAEATRHLGELTTLKRKDPAKAEYYEHKRKQVISWLRRKGIK